MKPFYIYHKLSLGDTAYLSDTTSDFIIEKQLYHLEDIVQVSSPNGIFHARIINIEKHSVEVEVIDQISNEIIGSTENNGITLIQSVSGDSKFKFLIEKSVELGVERIIPVVSEYSLLTFKQALGKQHLWHTTIKDAIEQSRTKIQTAIEIPIRIEKLLEEDFSNSIDFCMTTEHTKTKSFAEILKDVKITKPFVIAIGPEKGWSASDLNIFKKSGFKFIELKGNILRTETAGIAISSIIQFLKGKI
jgi:16S rRNA (uracil1498-N3)-methyltransferase